MLQPTKRAEATLALEGRLLLALQSATAAFTYDPSEQLDIAGGVVVLLLRHYSRAHPDPHAWLERALHAVLQP